MELDVKKMKFALLVIGAGMAFASFSSCARLFGDVIGDTIFLRGID
jgi:hypothetical protein